MHGCVTDIKILKTVGVEVVNLLDTATWEMTLTGDKEMVGLARLADKYLNIKLNKVFQVA